MICTKCKKHVAFTYVRPEGPLCLNCNLELNPPTMAFLKLGASGMLYNLMNDEYECYMDLEDFQNCGWFIRRKTIAANERNQVVATYYLEYYGNTVCNRCKQVVFPSFYTKCTDSTCCISGSNYAGNMINDF